MSVSKLYAYQYVCLVGLCSFLWLFYVSRNVIPLVVFINGVWYWSTMNQTARLIDIISNVILIYFVNKNTSWQPGTICCSVFAIISWCINLRSDRNVTSSVIHTITVQWVFCYALYRFVM